MENEINNINKNWYEEYQKEIEQKINREILYKQMLSQSREGIDGVIITMPLIINGLKFIAENQDIDQINLIQGLIDLGCNFTLEDIKNQFDCECNLIFGMSICDPACGASVIVNTRDSEFSRAYTNDRFLSKDDDSSIYHFIRETTQDYNYTKENVDSITLKKSKIKLS